MSSKDASTDDPAPKITDSSADRSDVPETTTSTFTTPKNPRACLLGLPAELRSMIFQVLFPREEVGQMWCGPTFLIRSAVHDRSLSESDLSTEYTSILRTSKAMYREAAEQLYSVSFLDVNVVVIDRGVYLDEAGPSRIGEIDDLFFWPYIRDLRLCVMLHNRGTQSHISEKVDQMVRALESGKHLRKLCITIDWVEHRPMPESFDDVLHALSCFEMPNKDVLVGIDGGLEEGESERYEKRLRRRIRRERSGQDGQQVNSSTLASSLEESLNFLG